MKKYVFFLLIGLGVLIIGGFIMYQILKPESLSFEETFQSVLNPTLNFLMTIIDEEDVVSDSLLTNVTAETGDANFTHLNISTTSPYDDLVGYWSFDGDKEDTLLTTHYDFTGYGNDGTGANQANTTSTSCLSNFGNCLQLDGVGDYVSVPSSISLNITKNLTLSVWVKPKETSSDLTDGDGILDKRMGVQTTYRIIHNAAANSIRFRIDTGAGTNCDASTDLQKDIWYYVTATYNGTHMGIFINGISENTCAKAGDIKTNNDALCIGCLTTGINSFNGTLDEIMIFNTYLSATQILAIYNNQSARFADTGKQELNDQTYLNITSGNDRVNVTTVFDNNFNSNLSLFLQYYNTTGWFSTSAQNLTSGVNSTFTIHSTATNLTLNYTLIAGNDSITTFYTPIVYDNIILDSYSVAVDTCTCPNNPATAWEVDMEDYCYITDNCVAAALTFINTGNFTCNATINVSSVEGLASGQRGYVTSNCRGLDRT